MKNRFGQTKEEALKNNTFDRLDFSINKNAFTGTSGLLGTMKHRFCRFCEAEKGKSGLLKCNSWSGLHTWNY